MRSQVTQGKGPENGFRNGVHEDIRIAVTIQSGFVVDFHTAQNQVPARLEGMNVHGLAYADHTSHPVREVFFLTAGFVAG